MKKIGAVWVHVSPSKFRLVVRILAVCPGDSDGKWRSFSKVPNLLQYVASGVYYGRVKVNGKSNRVSLETDVWTTALLRLPDFLKSRRQPPPKPLPSPSVRVAGAVEALMAKIHRNTAMKKRSKEYREFCIRKIAATWPDLQERGIETITESESEEWAANLHEEIAAQYFNNTVATLTRSSTLESSSMSPRAEPHWH